MSHLRRDNRKHESSVLYSVLSALKVHGPWIYHKARTTSSVYIKFASEHLRSLRIADHKGIDKYKYKWNVNVGYTGPPFMSLDENIERYFYSPNDLALLAADLAEFSIDSTTPRRFIACLNLSS